MFSDYGKELLRSGIIDTKAGNKDSARRYLDRALYISNDHDVLAEAWFWMSQVVDDPAEKRKALENCLTNNLGHARARRAFAVLDGKLKADQIINPDNLLPVPEGLHPQMQIVSCVPKGGHVFARMVNRLRAKLFPQQEFTASWLRNEKDLSLPWQRAGCQAAQPAGLSCEGVAANYFAPNQISHSVYCGSPTWSIGNRGALLAPDGIFACFDQQRAPIFDRMGGRQQNQA